VEEAARFLSKSKYFEVICFKSVCNGPLSSRNRDCLCCVLLTRKCSGLAIA